MLRLDVRKLVFHDPVVRIERTREGALNTEDVVRTRKKRTKRRDGSEEEALVLPELSVPIEVHGLTLVLVADDGREVTRGGIEFSGELTTRAGPTIFDLNVPVGGGSLRVSGDLTLFDANGVLLPIERLAVRSEVQLVALDAAENGDLLSLFVAGAPPRGVLDGRIALDSVGRKAQGEIELTVRDLVAADARGTRDTRSDDDDLRITCTFEIDGDTFAIRDGLLSAPGVAAHASFSGTLAAIDGEATMSIDVERGAAALRALGLDVPAGVAGRAEGRLTFRPSPSRGEGTLTIKGLRAPSATPGGTPLAIDEVTARIAVRPDTDGVTIDEALVSIPDELEASITGRAGRDGAWDVNVVVSGDVPTVVRRAKAMGLAPQDLAIAGKLRGVIGITRTSEAPRATIDIESLELRDEGVAVTAVGSLGGDGTVYVRVRGSGAIERLLAAGGADEQLAALRGTFSFAAAVDGPPDALAVEIEELELRGDLALSATGRMRADGRIEADATLDGRIPDAVALARGLGFVEGDVPLDGRIRGALRVAGSRTRPEIPSASLRIDDGPLDVNVTGAISEMGTVTATVEATAAVDALLAVAHAQGALARVHAPGGEVRLAAVIAGTREKPEMPTASVVVTGPLTARADGSLDAEGFAHVRLDFSGALEPLAALLAAVTDGDATPLAGAYEGALAVDGPLDRLQIQITRLLARSEGLTVDVGGTLRAGGAAQGSIAVRGPLEGAFAIAHSFGLLPEVSATGSIDAVLDATTTGDAGDRTFGGSLTGSVRDLVMLRADTPDAAWREERVSFSVPSFEHGFGAAPEGTRQRPLTLTLDTAGGVKLQARVLGGGGGQPLDLSADLSGPVQPLLDAAAVLTGGGAGTRIAGSIATEEPLLFRGDVTAGREFADGWTGGVVLVLTDVVAPYAAISSGTIHATIAGGLVRLDPIDLTINGGRATGNATIGLVGEKPGHTLSLHAKDVRIDTDLAPLLARASPLLAVGDAGDTGGTVGIDAELTAKGLDGDRLRRTVSGEGVMHLDGVYAESRNWIGKLLDMAGAGSRLEVASADVPFTVKRGRVTTEPLDVVGSGMDLRLGGEVGLDGTIDYAFDIRPNGGRAEFARFAEFLDDDGYLPLRLEGDLASPDLKLPSVSDALKGGLGGLLDKVLHRGDDETDDGSDAGETGDGAKKDGDEVDPEEAARRKRRRARRKRKKAEREKAEREAAERAEQERKEQGSGNDTPPPDDGAEAPRDAA